MHFNCFDPTLLHLIFRFTEFPMGECCFVFIALCAITLLEFSYLFETNALPQLKAIANMQPVLLILLLYLYTKLDLRINYYKHVPFLSRCHNPSECIQNIKTLIISTISYSGMQRTYELKLYPQRMVPLYFHFL